MSNFKQKVKRQAKTISRDKKITRTKLRYDTVIKIIRGFKVTMVNILRNLIGKKSRQYAKTNGYIKHGDENSKKNQKGLTEIKSTVTEILQVCFCWIDE